MDAIVTVVVVNWNGARHLKACLQALALQAERRFRAVVVDNASTDGSQEFVSQLGDERFSLLQLDSNTGFACGNNRGASVQPDTPWIALLNPDAFPEPGWLGELLGAATRRTGFSMFGCHLVSAADSTLSDGTGDVYHVSGRAWRRDHGVPVSQSHLDEGEIFAPCAAAAMFRRDAWVQAGGFDEDFFCYMEDVDLAFRLRLLGHRCLHVPTAVCHHVGSATTGRRSDFSAYYGQRNLVWAFAKNMPSWLFWLFLPAHLVLNAAAVVLFAKRGQLAVVLRAKRDALKAWPQLWRKRSHVQARRKIPAGVLWALLDKSLWPHH